MLGFLHRNLPFHQRRHHPFIDLFNHSLKQIIRLEFINQQRIFLFISSILNRLFQIIHFAEMFFPGIINMSQNDRFFERTHQIFTVRTIGLLQVGHYAVHPLTVGKRNDNILKDISPCFEYILDHRISLLSDMFDFTLISLPYISIQRFGQFIGTGFLEFLRIHFIIDGQYPQYFHPETFRIVHRLVFHNDCLTNIVSIICYSHTDTFS